VIEDNFLQAAVQIVRSFVSPTSYTPPTYARAVMGVVLDVNTEVALVIFLYINIDPHLPHSCPRVWGLCVFWQP
jgi:hypothetical protein